MGHARARTKWFYIIYTKYWNTERFKLATLSSCRPKSSQWLPFSKVGK